MKEGPFPDSRIQVHDGTLDSELKTRSCPRIHIHSDLPIVIASTKYDILGKDEYSNNITASSEEDAASESGDDVGDPQIPMLRIDELARYSPETTSSQSSTTRTSTLIIESEEQDIAEVGQHETDKLEVVRLEDVPEPEDLDDPFAFEPTDDVIDGLPRPLLRFVKKLRQSHEGNSSIRTKHARKEDSDDDSEDEAPLISAKRYGKRAKLTDHIVQRPSPELF